MTRRPSSSWNAAPPPKTAHPRCSAPTAISATRCRSAAWSGIATTSRRPASATTLPAATWRCARSCAQRIRDHAVFDAIAHSPVGEQRRLLGLARQQLGTVGGGNHYVDILEDEAGLL